MTPTGPGRIVPAVFRAVLLLALVALLVIGLRGGAGEPAAVRLVGDGGATSGDDDLAALATALLAPAPPTIFREAGRAPRELELAALEAAAARAPVHVELPDPMPSLVVAPPDRPVAGRFAALRFTVDARRFSGSAATTVTARLLGPGDAVLDSVTVMAREAGVAAGAFRVRPGRPGWTEWRVAVDRTVATAGAWVAPGEPPRVLVVAGPPGWESRQLLRALERGGVRLSLVQHLGRGNIVTAGTVPERWWATESLATHDVVILLPGADPDEEAVDALRDHVAAGHGALLAGGASTAGGNTAGAGSAGGGAAGGRAAGGGAADALSALGIAGGTTDVRPLSAGSVAWSAPPEVVPLPPAELEVAMSPFRGAGRLATVAAAGPDGAPLLLLAPLGRGRVGALGIGETWRWALEAGAEEEHRLFWRSLVDWLAAPSADSLAVRLVPAAAAAGATVEIAWQRVPTGAHREDGGHASGSAPAEDPGTSRPSATLHRPRASDSDRNEAEPATAEPLPLQRIAGGAAARFVAADTGLHEVQMDGEPMAGFRAVRPEAAPGAENGRGRLALLAEASGGGALEPDAFASAAAGGAPQGATWWRVLIFAALVGVAVAEWGLRRLRGER